MDRDIQNSEPSIEELEGIAARIKVEREENNNGFYDYVPDTSFSEAYAHFKQEEFWNGKW
jgi:hypothetical protein